MRVFYKEKSFVQIVTDSKLFDPLITINTIQSTYRTLYLFTYYILFLCLTFSICIDQIKTILYHFIFIV